MKRSEKRRGKENDHGSGDIDRSGSMTAPVALPSVTGNAAAGSGMSPTRGMRIGVAIPVILAGVFTLLLPFFFRPRMATVRPAGSSMTADRPASAPARVASPDAPPATPQRVPDSAAESAMAASPTNDYADYETARIAELNNLAMTDDPGALATIESEFDNRNPKIQEAAVAAAVQFGSRDALPALEAVYGLLDDPEQKHQVQEAIDFLKLPTPAEAAAGTATNSEAGSGN